MSIKLILADDDSLIRESLKIILDKSLFTEREIEVIESISLGLSNKEISQKLFISEGTVKNYITTIFQKTGLTHRTQIAIYYLK